MKRQASLGENIHVFSQKEKPHKTHKKKTKKKKPHIFLSYKKLVSKPCLKTHKLNNKKINYTILKIGKRFEKGLHKRS